MANENQLLDPINRRLLHELQTDARVTMAEAGPADQSVSPGGSRSRPTARTRRCDHGLPRGDRSEGDRLSDRGGRASAADDAPAPELPQLAREIPEVVDCHRITGEDCFFVKLHLRSMDDLEEILDRFIVLGQTTTSIVHSSPVAARPLPLDLAPPAAVPTTV